MSIEIDDPAEQSTASLVTGILGDLQHLVEQQLLLARRELEWEFRQRLAGVAVIVLGMMILVVAAIMFCLSGAHLLYWISSPPGTDQAWLPLWICHAVVGVVLVVVGGIVMGAGRSKLDSIGSTRNPASDILQEEVTWMNLPKSFVSRWNRPDLN